MGVAETNTLLRVGLQLGEHVTTHFGTCPQQIWLLAAACDASKHELGVFHIVFDVLHVFLCKLCCYLSSIHVKRSPALWDSTRGRKQKLVKCTVAISKLKPLGLLLPQK